jgi:hypothetical protein
MDTLGALALATEPPTDYLMQRPPVGRRFVLYLIIYPSWFFGVNLFLVLVNILDLEVTAHHSSRLDRKENVQLFLHPSWSHLLFICPKMFFPGDPIG